MTALRRIRLHDVAALLVAKGDGWCETPGLRSCAPISEQKSENMRDGYHMKVIYIAMCGQYQRLLCQPATVKGLEVSTSAIGSTEIRSYDHERLCSKKRVAFEILTTGFRVPSALTSGQTVLEISVPCEDTYTLNELSGFSDITHVFGILTTGFL